MYWVKKYSSEMGHHNTVSQKRVQTYLLLWVCQTLTDFDENW